jgi:hypothetical protein
MMRLQDKAAELVEARNKRQLQPQSEVRQYMRDSTW